MKEAGYCFLENMNIHMKILFKLVKHKLMGGGKVSRDIFRVYLTASKRGEVTGMVT